MLNRLSISNFVLFDHLELELTPGFTVISGETGAGKSLIIDAICLGLGARVSENPVRAGTKQTSISLFFTARESKSLTAFFDEYALEENQDEIHLRRVIQKSGQSKAFINDQPVNLTTLKALGEILLDAVGQFSTQSMLNPQTHLTFLDRYGQLEKEATATATSYDVWQKIVRDIKDLEEKLTLMKRDEDYYAHALDELSKASPEENEETALVEKRTSLMNGQKTQDALAAALKKLAGEKELDAQIFSAQRDLQRISDDQTPKVNLLIDKLEQFGSDARDILETLKDLHYESNQGGQSLEEADDRLHLLRGLARKYQTPGDGLFEYMQKLQQQANDTSSLDNELADQQKAAKIAFADYAEKALKLDLKRQASAAKITKSVLTLLPALKLDKARFEMNIETSVPEKGTRTGLNQVHMRVSMNPGTALAPMHKVASGGELSRFMLILSSLCNFDTKTILFDEIDTGVGGAVASAMGAQLKKMSTHQQVITLTHAPQVAALADCHFHVEKDQREETLTKVVELDKNAHLEEIARMLSGELVTDAAREAAKSLIKSVPDVA